MLQSTSGRLAHHRLCWSSRQGSVASPKPAQQERHDLLLTVFVKVSQYRRAARTVSPLSEPFAIRARLTLFFYVSQISPLLSRIALVRRQRLSHLLGKLALPVYPSSARTRAQPFVSPSRPPACVLLYDDTHPPILRYFNPRTSARRESQSALTSTLLAFFIVTLRACTAPNGRTTTLGDRT